MWAIPDLAAIQAVEGLYYLLAESEYPLASEGIPAAIRAAGAVHDVVKQLRRTHPDDPLLWASYVHFGR